MNAPTRTETPTGATAPTIGVPSGAPMASKGINAAAAMPIIKSWARIARPRFSTENRRQPPVKPNDA